MTFVRLAGGTGLSGFRAQSGFPLTVTRYAAAFFWGKGSGSPCAGNSPAKRISAIASAPTAKPSLLTSREPLPSSYEV